jgi:hypothetical protein
MRTAPTRTRQRGLTTQGVALLIAGALVALVAIASYWQAANYGSATEATLKGVLDDNENIYANGTQRVMEIAQVPGMYAADLKEVVKADIQGRYGPSGSQATMQWIRERGLTLDPSMYKAIQTEIVAFRTQFEAAQRRMIAQRVEYEKQLGYAWSGFWLARAGYPRVDLKDFKPVTTDKARQTFETKRDSGIQLRPSNP